jgi:hypothetical protein
MQTTLLPNDQIELDRLRVQSFITKWAFKRLDMIIFRSLKAL